MRMVSGSYAVNSTRITAPRYPLPLALHGMFAAA